MNESKKPTGQFTVRCTGHSRPIVERAEVNSFEDQRMDLFLNKGMRSTDVKDYSAKLDEVDLKVVSLNGNVLTVELE